MRACVIQYAGGYYTQLLAETFALHQLFCRRHRYDYLVSTIPWTDRHPYWEKCALLLTAAKKGYEQLVWLDSDTVWHGETLILPPTVFGMTRHNESNYFPEHYNAGVIYVNNSGGQAIQPLEEWWHTPETDSRSVDQGALNVVVDKTPELVTKLDHRWNSVDYIPEYKATNPAVSAWHGLEGKCVEQMRDSVWNTMQQLS